MPNGLQYAKATKVSLKDHPEFDEAWLRDVIAKDPSILGLAGELTLKDTERMQPRAGRLDLLLHDPDIEKRYEVEIMLGRVDESHIIRCIEYWDIERKHLPSLDHCAVLVAEEITSRFLNVISLFNGTIPMIALQLNALQIEGKIILNFTRVLDEISPSTMEEDDELSEKEVTDRDYWQEKGSELSLALADECEQLLREIDQTLSLTYNKHYIGLKQGNRPNNFAVFKAKKKFLRVEIKVSEPDALREELNKADIEVIGIGKRSGRVRVILNKGDIGAHRDLLKNIFTKSYKESVE
jgi:predicted transport protein